MKLNIVPARTGLLWVKLGVRTFVKQPLALAGSHRPGSASTNLRMPHRLSSVMQLTGASVTGSTPSGARSSVSGIGL